MSLLEHAFQGVDIERRVIYLCEDTTTEVFVKISVALDILESKSLEPITIRINSGGGDVDAAAAIVARMIESKCEIHTVGYGEVSSAATLILAAGDHRSIFQTLSIYVSRNYRTSGRKLK